MKTNRLPSPDPRPVPAPADTPHRAMRIAIHVVDHAAGSFHLGEAFASVEEAAALFGACLGETPAPAGPDAAKLSDAGVDELKWLFARALKATGFTPGERMAAVAALEARRAGLVH